LLASALVPLFSCALGCALGKPVGQPPASRVAVPAPAPAAEPSTIPSAPTASPPSVSTAPSPAAPRVAPLPPSPVASWSEYNRAGREALRLRDLPEAELSFTDAYALTRTFRAGDPRTEATVKNLQRVANGYLQTYRMVGFERVMGLLAQISIETPRTRTPEFAKLFTTLAVTFTAEGRHAEARDALERAIEIQGARSRQSDPALVSMHAQLGITYLELGDEKLGRYHVQMALGIAETSEGADGPLYAQALVGKARLESLGGSNAQAERDLRKALETLVREFGDGSPAIAGVVRELAGLYQRIGLDGDAEREYARVVSIWDGIPGERFQQALSRNDLAWFLVETGKPADAERYARDALDLLDAQGVEGQPLASVADTLATALRDQRKYEEAEALYRRAMLAGEAGDALPGFSTDAIAQRYAALLDATGRAAEATELREESGLD